MGSSLKGAISPLPCHHPSNNKSQNERRQSIKKQHIPQLINPMELKVKGESQCGRVVKDTQVKRLIPCQIFVVRKNAETQSDRHFQMQQSPNGEDIKSSPQLGCDVRINICYNRVNNV